MGEDEGGRPVKATSLLAVPPVYFLSSRLHPGSPGVILMPREVVLFLCFLAGFNCLACDAVAKR